MEGRPLDMVEQLVGMQAQVPLDPYIGLWSRLQSFDPEQLGRDLLERRLVRLTLMRATLHLVSRADALRLSPLLQSMLERAFASSPFARALSGIDLEPVVARGIELVEQRPRTIAQLRAALANEWPGQDANALAYAVRYLVPLVQVTPRGVWGQTMQPTVTTLTGWVDGTLDRSSHVDELVLRYLRAFGPASTADVRAWSWLRDVRSIIARLRPKLCVYREETGCELYDVADGLFADPATPAPVRFLPQYDNAFLAHADRSRIMDKVVWGPAFTHHGAFFVDGFLAGAWKLTKERREVTLTVEPHTRIRPVERKLVREEAEALLEFLTPDNGPRQLRLQ